MIQANPFEHLDLIDYACQELLVSFAVSNVEGLSMFSPPISLIINGGNPIIISTCMFLIAFNSIDEQLIPIPPNNLTISEEIDEREGFFGHVIVNISWDVPQSM